MKISFYSAAFCFVISLFLILGCQTAPKNDCEISKEEAEKMLGQSVIKLDKTAPQLGLEGKALTDPRFRACEFRSDKDKNDPAFLHWVNSEYPDRDQAKKFFEETFKNNSQYKADKSVSGIGNDALLFQAEDAEVKEIGIIVRKESNVFLVKKRVKIGKPISVEEIKSLAEKISLKTSY